MSLIVTKRLYISEAKIEDAPFFFELMNSPKWLSNIGDRGIQTIDHAADYIKNHLIHNYTTQGYGFYKLTLQEKNTPIGICGFAKRDYLEHVDIGFAILPQYERKGFTQEASQAVLHYGVTTLKLHPILGITMKTNMASRNVLQKIGLNEVGLVRTEENEELLLFSNE